MDQINNPQLIANSMNPAVVTIPTGTNRNPVTSELSTTFIETDSIKLNWEDYCYLTYGRILNDYSLADAVKLGDYLQRFQTDVAYVAKNIGTIPTDPHPDIGEAVETFIWRRFSEEELLYSEYLGLVETVPVISLQDGLTFIATALAHQNDPSQLCINQSGVPVMYSNGEYTPVTADFLYRNLDYYFNHTPTILKKDYEGMLAKYGTVLVAGFGMNSKFKQFFKNFPGPSRALFSVALITVIQKVAELRERFGQQTDINGAVRNFVEEEKAMIVESTPFKPETYVALQEGAMGITTTASEIAIGNRRLPVSGMLNVFKSLTMLPASVVNKSTIVKGYLHQIMSKIPSSIIFSDTVETPINGALMNPIIYLLNRNGASPMFDTLLQELLVKQVPRMCVDLTTLDSQGVTFEDLLKLLYQLKDGLIHEEQQLPLVVDFLVDISKISVIRSDPLCHLAHFWVSKAHRFMSVTVNIAGINIIANNTFPTANWYESRNYEFLQYIATVNGNVFQCAGNQETLLQSWDALSSTQFAFPLEPNYELLEKLLTQPRPSSQSFVYDGPDEEEEPQPFNQIMLEMVNNNLRMAEELEEVEEVEIPLNDPPEEEQLFDVHPDSEEEEMEEEEIW